MPTDSCNGGVKMTIAEHKFDSARDAITFLEQLMDTTQLMVFRGQQNSDFNLKTTYQRFTSIPPESGSGHVDEIVNTFRTNLHRVEPLSHDENDRAYWLEMAQHHGAPTPYLDFTYSPYIALFFAFNNLRRNGTRTPYVVVYALNVDQLAHEWALRIARGPNGGLDDRAYHEAYRAFKYQPQLFQHGFPGNTLQFVPFPSKHNVRMQRQHGAFLYDSIRYPLDGHKHLEEFIDAIKEPEIQSPKGGSQPGSPTLVKVYINVGCAGEVFTRLEMMGVSGSMLFLDAEGAAMDTWNTYWYNPRAMQFRDIEFPPEDDREM